MGRPFKHWSLRGGTYLIGLTKKAYDNVDFQALPWQTPNLFQSILASFSEKKIQILDQLQDVNTFKDLVSLYKIKPIRMSEITKGIFIKKASLQLHL